MSEISLTKLFLPVVFASGAVFTALAAPIALFAHEPIKITTGDSTLDGQVQDFSTPYLGVAGAISVGMAISGVALAGWKNSTQKARKAEEELENARKELFAREFQVQQTLFSEQQLSQTGLDFFLEDDTLLPQSLPQMLPTANAQPAILTQVALPQAVETHLADSYVPAAKAVREVVASVPVAPVIPDVVPSFTVASEYAEIQPVKVPKVTVQTAVSPHYAAQGFLSFARSGVPASASVSPAQVQDQVSVTQVQELQLQLQHLVAQIEVLQAGLQSQAPVGQFEVIGAPKSKPVSRVQAMEQSWMMQHAS
jgi:hypothetical protein